MDAPKENAGIPDDKANAAGTQPPDPIKEAELLRIQSEIARNEAETRKFNSEAKDFDGKHSKGKTDTIIKAVIGGMVLAGLLAAWFISYMQPILEKNRKLGELEKQVHEAENKIMDQKLKDDSTTLNALRQAYDRDQIAYNKNLQQFKAQNDSLKVQQEQIMQELSKYAQAGTEIQYWQDELNKIKAAQVKTESRSDDINDKIISNWLIENDWTMLYKWEGESYHTFDCMFYPNGKWGRKDVPSSIRTWQIKKGKLIMVIGTNFITFTTNITKMQSPLEGIVIDAGRKSGTWKMTKESNAAN
jgi:hypothetical protein